MTGEDQRRAKRVLEEKGRETRAEWKRAESTIRRTGHLKAKSNAPSTYV